MRKQLPYLSLNTVNMFEDVLVCFMFTITLGIFSPYFTCEVGDAQRVLNSPGSHLIAGRIWFNTESYLAYFTRLKSSSFKIPFRKRPTSQDKKEFCQQTAL